jgi:hypothetical protein
MAKSKNEGRDYDIFHKLHYKYETPLYLACYHSVTTARIHQIYMEQCAIYHHTPDMLVIPPTNSKERMAIARFNGLVDKMRKIRNGDEEWMGLDSWTVSALKRFGCTDPNKLHMYSSERLLDAPGLGRLRVNRIREVLAARNKYLSGELPGVSEVDFIICPHCEGKVEHASWGD